MTTFARELGVAEPPDIAIEVIAKLIEPPRHPGDMEGATTCPFIGTSVPEGFDVRPKGALKRASLRDIRLTPFIASYVLTSYRVTVSNAPEGSSVRLRRAFTPWTRVAIAVFGVIWIVVFAMAALAAARSLWGLAAAAIVMAIFWGHVSAWRTAIGCETQAVLDSLRSKLTPQLPGAPYRGSTS